jgi:hypothetical protein
MSEKTYAIYSDYSGVTQPLDMQGGFATEVEALEECIRRLEGQKYQLQEKLTRVRCALRKARKGTPQ